MAIGSQSVAIGWPRRPKCARALTYEAWQGARRDLDEHEGGAAWQRCHVSPFYDVRLVTTALETLRRVEAAAVASGDPSQLAELVVTLCNRSLASLDDPNNFRFPGIGAPAAVVLLPTHLPMCMTNGAPSDARRLESPLGKSSGSRAIVSSHREVPA